MAITSSSFSFLESTAWSSSSSFSSSALPSSSLPSSSYTWNDKGCQEWPKANIVNSSTTTSGTTSTSTTMTPPTGMAVTLARRADVKGAPGTFDLLCQKIPTQQAYFFEPHGIDLLLLVDIHGITIQDVADCLQLKPYNPNDDPQQQQQNQSAIAAGAKGGTALAKNWTNLDGSIITTYHYKSKTQKGNVYLVQYEMPYPNYIQANMTLLEEPMWDCQMPYDYVQGTRYYSDQFLHLKILESYEYMIKIDLDVEFKTIIPFNVLWDMKQQGAIFGHTGEFPRGLKACCKGIEPVMKAFVEEYGTKKKRQQNNATISSSPASWTDYWKGRPCSEGVQAFERGADQWYTNLVFMNREFFQSEPVRAYGRWMNEYNPGYFKYRWSDQLFFHIAMGMFLGPDFRNYVLDYTDLRCRRFTNCWFFWAGGGTNQSTFCQVPGAVFHHGKNRKVFGPFSGIFPNVTSPMKNIPYDNKYRHDCDHLPANE